MTIEEKLKDSLTEAGWQWRENDRSVITRCPQCGKQDHLYIFKGDKNNAKCMKCGQFYTPAYLIVAVTGCSYEDARRLLQEGGLIRADEELGGLVPISGPVPQKVGPKSIPLPANFLNINDPASQTGKKYLLDRGVHQEVLDRFDIKCCTGMGRVVFPITMNGVVTGWQARDYTGTQELRYMSPQGFNKGAVLMGYDLIDIKKDYVVLVEGPIDALRVAAFFPTLCSMGKNVSNTQIDLIKSLPHIKKVYLGLDPDAWDLFDKIAAQLEPTVKVYIYQPPENRKDFGETDDREILESFKKAKRYSKIGSLPMGILK